jgi:hypothetical protein
LRPEVTADGRSDINLIAGLGRLVIQHDSIRVSKAGGAHHDGGA